MLARSSQSEARDSAVLLRELTDAERALTDGNTCLSFHVFVSGDVVLQLHVNTLAPTEVMSMNLSVGQGQYSPSFFSDVQLLLKL